MFRNVYLKAREDKCWPLWHWCSIVFSGQAYTGTAGGAQSAGPANIIDSTFFTKCLPKITFLNLWHRCEACLEPPSISASWLWPWFGQSSSKKPSLKNYFNSQYSHSIIIKETLVGSINMNYSHYFQVNCTMHMSLFSLEIHINLQPCKKKRKGQLFFCDFCVQLCPLPFLTALAALYLPH